MHRAIRLLSSGHISGLEILAQLGELQGEGALAAGRTSSSSSSVVMMMVMGLRALALGVLLDFRKILLGRRQISRLQVLA